MRNKTGASLSEAGKKFLTYCEMIEGLELEFLDDFIENNKLLKGVIRPGVFSTIGRSVVLPVFQAALELMNKDIPKRLKMKLN